MVCRSLRSAVPCLAFAGLSLPASAQTTISVVNFSFENPSTSTFTTSIPDWSGDASCGVHSFAFVAGQFLDASAPDGSQFGYINRGSIFQDVGETITAGQTYTLTGFLGRRNDAQNVLGSASLYSHSGAVLATTGFMTSPAGRFTEFSVSFTAESSMPYLGEGLRLQLANISDGLQVNFDKITLTKTAVVPAPSSLCAALMATSWGVVLLRRRSHKSSAS